MFKLKNSEAHLSWLWSLYNLPDLESEEIRKRRLYVLLSVLGIILLLTFGIYHLFAENFYGGCLTMAGALIVCISAIALRHIKRGTPIYRFNAFAFFIIILFWTVNGGQHGEKIMWSYPYPLMVAFLLGRKEGMLWNGAFFGIICLLFLIDDRLPIYVYQLPLKIRFICIFLVVSLLTYNYELFRQLSQDNYNREQAKLREEKKKLAQATASVQAANKALLKSETLLKQAQNIADIGNWEYDYNTQRLWGSAETLAMLGISITSPYIHLEQLKKVIPDFADLAKDIAVQLEQSQSLNIEFTGRRRSDNTLIDLHARAEVVRDDQRQVSRLTGVIQDITRRKVHEREKRELREKLERSKKMEALGLLAGGVAHDLNNVMLGLVSYPDFLLTKMTPEDPFYRPLKTICQAGQKAAAIVEDLLTLARRGVTSTEVLNLNAVIEEYLISPEFEKLRSFHKKVKFITHLEPNPLNVKGSQLHLKKCVMNLISNAAESIEQSGIVVISTANCYIDRPIKGYSDVQQGDYIRLQVEDNGTGIETKDLPHIFEPFYTKKIMGRSGTGLGMAVVWGAIQDHKGYIDLQSQVGKGTKIEVYLPITREALPGKQVIRPVQDYMGQGEQILIVDDVPEQRALASQMLSELGYQVHTAASGEAAVQFMQEHSVDLLVLDMIMEPGIDGLETYQRILKLHPRQKAIIVSGFSETERVRQAQRLGAGTYVKKPYVLEDLGMAIRKELRK